MPSPRNAFSTTLPTFHEWIELTGGRQNRTDPLLKFIDNKVKSHELIFKRFKRKPVWGLLWERLGCELELLYGTGMYVSAHKGRYRPLARNTPGLSGNAFGTGRIQRDGRTVVNAPKQYKDDSNWTRIDAIEALHSLAEEDLCGLTDARDKTALLALIRKAKVCDIDPGKYAEDTKVIDEEHGKTAAKYLGMDELGKYRVMFDGGLMKMRCETNLTQSLYEWVLAETAESRNQCAKDLIATLKETNVYTTQGGGFKSDVFKRGDQEYYDWYRKEHTGVVGGAGYVLTPGQRMYMSSAHKTSGVKTQGFFHSAYTKGGGVTCSGSICIERGFPTLITNLSGHYLPDPRKLDYLLRLFQINSVPTNRLAILAATRTNKWFYKPGEKSKFRRDLRTMK